MKCPKCDGDWKKEAMNTRGDDPEYVWRRRVCQKCGYTKSTYEYPFNLMEIFRKILKILQD